MDSVAWEDYAAALGDTPERPAFVTSFTFLLPPTLGLSGVRPEGERELVFSGGRVSAAVLLKRGGRPGIHRLLTHP